MQKTHTAEYLAEKFRALRRLTGNTPLLGIHFRYRGMTRTIYAKSEQLNMTGSIKDRMALHILRKAYEEGKIHPGDIIVVTRGYPLRPSAPYWVIRYHPSCPIG